MASFGIGTRPVLRVGGNVFDLHRLPGERHSAYDRFPVDRVGVRSLVIPVTGAPPAGRHEVEEVTVSQEHERDIRVTQLGSLRRDPVEDRLKLEAGTGDRAQDAANGSQGP